MLTCPNVGMAPKLSRAAVTAPSGRTFQAEAVDGRAERRDARLIHLPERQNGLQGRGSLVHVLREPSKATSAKVTHPTPRAGEK